MHTSTQIMRDSYEVEIDGIRSEIDDLTPHWEVHDRFGIVVRETLGTLGASLLIQLAVSNFYATKPSRRDSEPEYPEIYVFHDGGPHGDHSVFDFWPPRKEVRVPAHDHIALLEAINSRGITRLALPDGPIGRIESLKSGPSTWADLRSATARLTSCFAYSADGDVAGADVVIRSQHPRIEENANDTLDPLTMIKELVEASPKKFIANLPGPSEPVDVYRWVNLVGQRLGEIPEATRAAITKARAERIRSNGGVSSESYRRLSTNDAFALLAGVVGV